MKDQLSILNIVARLGCSGILISMLFGAIHWPYRTDLLLLSCAIFMAAYTAHIIIRPNKITRDYYKFGAAMCWVLNLVFKSLHFPGASIFGYLFLAFLGFMIMAPKRAATQKKSRLRTFKNVLVIIGVASILCGSAFKIMHWPGASLALISGYLLLIFWLLLGGFVRSQPVVVEDEIEEIGKS